jgi:Xaa-Pro dipeptidase
MPVEGDVTAGVFNRAAWWNRAQDWISDVRDCANDWGRLVVDRLHEFGFSKTGCIGISGLGWLQRAPDGIVPYATVMTIKEAFPLATIVDASNLMQQIRAVKSDVEVDLMRHSLVIIETMLDAAAAQASPGIREKDIYATMVGKLLAADGELPSMLIFGTGPAGSHSQFVPTNRALEPGDVLSGEIEGRYCGYSGQIIHPISLGAQSADYVDLLKAATTCLLAIAESMRPGRTMGDLMDVYEKTLKGAGHPDFEFSHPMMHARGLGDEFPFQTKSVNIAKFRAIELASGMTFVVKPRVRSSRSKLAAQMGETIVVRPQGGQRLGKRPLELRVV